MQKVEDALSGHLAEVNRIINAAGSVIPAQRAAHKKGFSFSKQEFARQLPIWQYVWAQSSGFRPMLHAYFFLEQYVTRPEHHAAIWHTSKLWQEDVNDWPLCDSLSKLNTKVLESYPAEVYAALCSWNKSPDLWKRRQSVVSLLYYSRTKKVFLPFEQIAALILPLLTDKEYYVQKGVGWTLRELYDVYPDLMKDLLARHIHNISPIAFTIAIEKMSTAEKEAIKLIRKKKKE